MTVRIVIERIEDIQGKFKDGQLTLSMTVPLYQDGDIARLSFLSRQKVPLNAVIESPQAEMDLRFEKVSTRTGEIKNDGHNKFDDTEVTITAAGKTVKTTPKGIKEAAENLKS